jgi:hypothetical protein
VRDDSKLRKTIFRLFVVFLCVFPIYQWGFKPLKIALDTMGRGNDAVEAGRFYDYITNQINFEQRSILDTNRPPIYFHARNHGLRVDVYGITNSETQKRFVVSANDWQSTNSRVAELQLRFFAQEQPRTYYGQHIEPLLKEVIFSKPSLAPR